MHLQPAIFAENAGGYVLVAVLAFMAGAVITAVLLKQRLFILHKKAGVNLCKSLIPNFFEKSVSKFRKNCN